MDGTGSARDLPEDLELPLASGAEWWYFTGGRLSVDFVNTLRERWWRRVETLITSADLAGWLERVGLLERGAAAPTDAELALARQLREAINDAFEAVIAGTPPSRESLAAIDALLGDAHAPLRLASGPDGHAQLTPAPVQAPVRRALAGVALDAAELLAGERARARLRICASETCSARFFDNSPAGRRQWCSMRTCGNAAKARRHRARRREHSPTPQEGQ